MTDGLREKACTRHACTAASVTKRGSISRDKSLSKTERFRQRRGYRELGSSSSSRQQDKALTPTPINRVYKSIYHLHS